MTNQLLINFTPTGMIPTKSQTPHVPISPNEIIEQTIEAYELGITMVHLHARDEHEVGTYKAEVYGQIFEGIRKYCSDLVICASLSGRNFSEIEKRTEVLTLKPDMGSLTLSSLNFMNQESLNAPETILSLIETMDKHGVTPELECFDAGMVNFSKYLIKKGLLKPPHYYNIILGNIASAQSDPLQIGVLLKELPNDSIWALGGLGETQLKANMFAVSFGGGVRVGLEDNIWFDASKTTLATNVSLIKRIHMLASIADRPILSAKEFGNMGFYNRDRKMKLL